MQNTGSFCHITGIITAFFRQTILQTFFLNIYNNDDDKMGTVSFRVFTSGVLFVYSGKSMKTIVTEKLKSNSGASLMVALLFFVMAATVGSIILAAATASSGRLANLKKSEQGYYAMSSAADVLTKTILDEKCKVIIQLKKPGGEGDPEGGISTMPVYLDPRSSTSTEINPDTYVLPNLINKLYQPGYFQYDTEFPANSNSKKDKTDSLFVQGYGDLNVSAIYTLDSMLNLTIELTPEAGGTNTVKEKMTLRFKPVVEEERSISYHDMKQLDDERNIVFVKTYTVRWTNPIIE